MALGPHPEFSWSVSQAGMFDYCPRKYYLRYHESWGGWEWSAPERKRTAYLLSKRVSMPAWVGQEVHRSVALHLLGRETIQTLVDALRQRMSRLFQMSCRRRFLEPGEEKSFGLIEHYYGQEIPEEELAERVAHAEACLRYVASRSFRKAVRKARKAGRAFFVEEPDGGDFEQMKLRSHGLGDWPIFARPDLVLTRETGVIGVLDWKTGKVPPEDRRDHVTLQLALYCRWAGERLELGDLLPLERMKAYELYLPGGELRGGQPTRDDLEEALEAVRGSVREIRSCLADPDTNRAEEAGFPARGTPAKCRICEFRGICPERCDA